MNDLVTVNNVRGYIENGVAYVNLEDVARGLGFTTVAKSGNECIRWNRVTQYLLDLGFMKSKELPEFIPESIFYKLCMKANNEIARRFQDLVCEEILPSIRKHGMYATENTIENMINNPDFAIELLVKLKEERAEKARLEIDNQRKTETITTAINSLMGIEKDTDRRNLNSLVKSLSEEYCNIHNLNSKANISDVYMTIYRDFCKHTGVNFIELQRARIKYKKNNPTIQLSTKKSYIEVIEEKGLASELLSYLKDVKVKDIL